MKLLPLINCADLAIVDDDDYERLSQHKWKRMQKRHHTPHYVYCTINRKCTLLHIVMLGKLPKGHVWDHINRNVLDNRRSNLRAVSNTWNAIYKVTQNNNTSGVRGVHWQGKVRGKPWLASIGFEGKSYHLGVFATLEEVTIARQYGELKYFGELCPISGREFTEWGGMGC